MNKYLWAKITMLLLLPFCATVVGAEQSCIDCHQEKTPGAVLQWQASAHAKAAVGCVQCHGNNHERMIKGEARVDAIVCGKCHQQAYTTHSQSKHGIALHTGWGCTRHQPSADKDACKFCHQEGSTDPISSVHCARFLKQSAEMGQLGCNRCHLVENSCASCHTNHSTAPEIVHNPAICAKCHMGPDHPQWEMWQTSLHGALYASSGATLGPTCQSCHMTGGSHDVSSGIATHTSGKGKEAKTASTERDAMLQICLKCHAESFARKDLEMADAVRDQSLQLVKEATEIIIDLYDRQLLDPMPEERPAHPLKGQVLVLDGQMLYEDYSHIERLFFKMKKYDLAKTLKGAYHQNPAYTHWYGNAELKMDLVDIKAEAQRLKQLRGVAVGRSEQERKPTEVHIEQELGLLKKRFEREDLSADAYAQEKKKLLDQLLTD